MLRLHAIIVTALLALAAPAPLKAAPLAETPAKLPKGKKKLAKPRSPQSVLHEQLLATRRAYRMGDISRRAAWEKLDWFHDRGQLLMSSDRVILLSSQATLLMDAGYPILAAIYASQALKISDVPLDRDMEPAWAILRTASEKRSIQSVLEVMAEQVDLHGRTAPVFGSDWEYILANSLAKRSDVTGALEHYALVKPQSRYFYPAQYQSAMLLIDQGKAADAERHLKQIVAAAPVPGPVKDTSLRQLKDYAYLALGRLYYEQQRFLESAKSYRLVDKNGANFYDALFEQAWAFFMGGYPMHALGALYAAESPFYAEVFNPEATMLRSMIHYWLCRYEDSRNGLADFMEKHAEPVEKLTEFLDRQRLDPETAYQLFENLVSGVSGESLGLPKAVLQTASERDAMLLVRDQYASILEEKSRLEARGVFGSKLNMARSLDYLDRWAASLRKDIGKRFLAELQDMKKDYDGLYAQAQFLYVELLMSEKDQLLGKELHASTKITKVSQKMKVSGWAGQTQAWKDSRHGEYWWDEVGFYITPVDSMCTQNAH